LRVLPGKDLSLQGDRTGSCRSHNSSDHHFSVDLKAEISDELNPTAGENLATLGASLVMPLFSNYTRFAYRFTTRHMQPKTVINRYHYTEAKQKRAVDVKVKVPAIVAR